MEGEGVWRSCGGDCEAKMIPDSNLKRSLLSFSDGRAEKSVPRETAWLEASRLSQIRRGK